MTDLAAVLQEFHKEKLSALLRHQAGARSIQQYDINNAYQYIINREETQLSWLTRALAELGITVQSQPEPERKAKPGSSGADAARQIIEEDAQEAAAFVERWRPRVEAIADARHRGTLRVILGETLEQKRFFEQALAGQLDLLGRRTSAVGVRVGKVLPTRWLA